MQLFNVGNNGINLYLIDSGSHRLLIDSGFPGKLNDLGREMRKTGYKIQDIDYLLVTHFHIDHAGGVQELKDLGVKFILFDLQANHIELMEKMTEKKWPYKRLKKDDNIVLNIDESRSFLHKTDIQGQVIHTPGHSDDSISLLLDTRQTFTGDLTHNFLIMDKTSVEYISWITLKEHKAKFIFPSHGKEYELED